MSTYLLLIGVNLVYIFFQNRNKTNFCATSISKPRKMAGVLIFPGKITENRIIKKNKNDLVGEKFLGEGLYSNFP